MPTVPTPLTALVAGLLLATALFAAPTHAGEEAPPKGAAGPQKAAPEKAAAEMIGRDLLASDAAVRRRAIDRLLVRATAGGDLRAFFEHLGKATADWANRRERLMEVWIDQAVHGTAKEREEAARLLSALGPVAVRRLALELRHARAQGGVFRTPAPSQNKDGEQPTRRAASGAPKTPIAKPAAPRPTRHRAPVSVEPPAQAAHVYDVRDLRARGMNAVETRSLLQKVPDAVEVKDVGGGIYVVTAAKAGHLALRIRLEELRTSMQRLENRHKQADAEPKDSRRWQVVPSIYRVPRNILAPTKGRLGTAAKQAGLPQGIDPRRTEVRTGSAMDAGMWMRLLQQGRGGARGDRPAGKTIVAAGRNGVFFAGTERTYRKGLKKNAAGRYELELGSLRSGIELDFALVPEGEHLALYLVATRSEVAEPVPTDVVKRPTDGSPIEIDRPDWIRTRTRIPFRLPAAGGGAFLSLGGLGSTEEEHLIVVLRVTRLGPPQTAK